MPDPPLRILLVDDNPDDRALVERTLRQAFDPLEVTAVMDEESFQRVLGARAHDLVITDYQLKWTTGLDVLRRLKQAEPETPVIMFTGTGSEEIAVDAMKSGLDDYVLKTVKHVARLRPAVRTALERRRLGEARRTAEDRYGRLFQDVPVGLYRSTLDGRFLDANPAFLAMFGFPDLNALRRTKAEAVYADPTDRPKIAARLLATGHVRGVEVRLRRIDGRVFWGRGSAHLIRDASGQPAVVEGVVEDIAEEKEAMESLVRSEAKFRAMFNTSADGIFLVSTRGVVLDANRAAEVGSGRARSELVGQTIMDILNPDQRARASRYMDEVVAGRPPAAPLEVDFEGPRGNRMVLSIRGHPVVLPEEDPIVEVIVRDVTRERETQRRLLESEKFAAAGRVAAYVAHELNTPLTNLSLLATSAARLSKDPALLEKIGKIDAQRRNATKIISDLMDVARFREVQPVETDLRAVAQAAAAQVELFRGADTELTLDLGDEPVVAGVDALQVQQVLVNPIKNAYQATTKGQVTVALRASEDAVAFTVTDTGEGIPAEVRGHVFEPFYTTKTGTRGTGLGLAFCSSVVAAHGGDIGVHSEAGKGTTFSIVLPRRQVRESPRGG